MSKPTHKPSFLITAGPTREYLDPVRFLSNPSTGKTGVALARQALCLGSRVTLCLGPVNQDVPEGIQVKRFSSARELLKQVSGELDKHDILIMSAAVSDYRPVTYQRSKIKKTDPNITLSLIRNPDILKTLSPALLRHNIFVAGFAAETEKLTHGALQKLKDKKMHLIIANRVHKEKKGFNIDTNNIKIYSKNSRKAIAVASGHKEDIAKIILHVILGQYKDFNN